MQIDIPRVEFKAGALAKDAWLVLLHARRIPPHAGLLINGVYNSLTIKGHELNVSREALLKTIDMRRIEAVFLKLLPQPVFSLSFQCEIFMEIIKKENPVTPNGSTCLTPIKLFFREFYNVPVIEEELLFDFINRLTYNNFITHFSSCHLPNNEGVLEIPFYSSEELHERIMHERMPYYNN